jgi:hypothetical protein
LHLHHLGYSLELDNFHFLLSFG